MPETQLLEPADCGNLPASLGKCSTLSHRNSKCLSEVSSDWLWLPYELWLGILVDHGVTASDLVHLDYACKWFGNCWGDGSVTEEAARLIIKRWMRKRFGDMVNRVSGGSWKQKLYTLEAIRASAPTLAAGSYQNICIRDNHVLTWGAGKFGQLGNQGHEDKPGLQNITSLLPEEAGQVIQVSAGCGHTGFVTDKGFAFTCGDNRYGQLGHSDFRGQTCKMPMRIRNGLEGVRIQQIACGSSHTLLLSDVGRVYIVGQGDSGQLGLGPGVGGVPMATCIPFPYETYNIVHITAGIAHNIWLSDCGKVFTYGLASLGQLGHGGTKNLHQPTLVSVLRHLKIVSVSAGVCQSIFVDSAGAAYTCGKGKGLLGHTDTRIRTVPTKVASLQGIKIVSSAAGVGRSVFIGDDGTGYWCGEGIGEMKNHTALLPTVMRLPEALQSAAIGNSHMVLKMKSGCLMTIGSNGRYQTGHVTEHDAPVDSFTYVPMDAVSPRPQ